MAENRAIKSYLRIMVGTTPGTQGGLSAVEAKTAQRMAKKYVDFEVEQADKTAVTEGAQTYMVYDGELMNNEGTETANKIHGKVVRAMDIDMDDMLHTEKCKAVLTMVKLSMRSKKRVLKDKGLMELTEEDKLEKGRSYGAQKNKKQKKMPAERTPNRTSPRRGGGGGVASNGNSGSAR